MVARPAVVKVRCLTLFSIMAVLLRLLTPILRIRRHRLRTGHRIPTAWPMVSRVRVAFELASVGSSKIGRISINFEPVLSWAGSFCFRIGSSNDLGETGGHSRRGQSVFSASTEIAKQMYRLSFRFNSLETLAYMHSSTKMPSALVGSVFMQIAKRSGEQN